MPEITVEQREAVDAYLGPVLVTAGAGSGKTTLLVEKYLSLLERGIAPEQILAVTFTLESAAELKQRISRRLGSTEGLNLSRIGTIHSFCLSLINRFGEEISIPPIRRVLTEAEASRVWENVLDTFFASASEAQVLPLLQFFPFAELRASLARLTNQFPLLIHSPENHAAYSAVCATVSQIYQAFREKTVLEGLYRFSDLEEEASTILQSVPRVRTRLREEIRYLLIDEFQDTSRQQWHLLSAIAAPDLSNVFLVGDPKQSIYRFRHADVSLFMEILDGIERGSGSLCPLTVNFRSSAKLTETVNQISERLFAGATIPFQPMRSAAEAEGPVPIELMRLAGTTRAEYEATELQSVAESVANLRDVPPEQVAILFRSSDRMADFQRALEERRIPCRYVRVISMGESLEIQHFLNLVRATLNPTDDFSVAALLLSPFVQLTPQELTQLRARRELSIETALHTIPALAERARWWLDLGQNSNLKLEQLLLATQHSQAPNLIWEPLIGSVIKLLANTHDLSEVLAQLEQWCAEGVKLQQPMGHPRGVRLMTVHISKGLEFSHVYLVDLLKLGRRDHFPIQLCAGRPPGLRYREKGEVLENDFYRQRVDEGTGQDLEESKRLLYVALTRAKHAVHIALPTNPKLIPKNSWADFLQKN